MTFYLASRYDNKFFLRGVRDKLSAMGHEVFSNWIDEKEPPNIQLDEVPVEKLQEYALQDITEIEEVDAFVHFQSMNRPNIRGGALVEFGMAYIWGLEMIIVGDRVNIFDFLPAVTCFPTVEEFLTWAEKESA